LTKEQIGMSKKRTKQYLLLLMVIGLVSIAAGGGTFASFSAETTNSGNYFASGTLFLHNTHAGTTCTSETSNDNLTPTGCDTLLTLPIISAGSTYTAHLTLQNAGTIDASDIKLFSPGGCTDANGTIVHALLDGAVNSGDPVSSLTVHPVAGTIAAGDTVVVSDPTGNHKQTFTVDTGGAAAGAVSIPVVADTWNYSYDDFSDVNDTTASGPTPIFSTSQLCSGLKIYIEETNSSNAVQDCSYGTTLGAASCTVASSGALSGIPTTRGAAATLDLTPDLGTNTGTKLSAGQSREFNINVVAPATLDNTYQDRSAKFDLTWHIDQ